MVILSRHLRYKLPLSANKDLHAISDPNKPFFKKKRKKRASSGNLVLGTTKKVFFTLLVPINNYVGIFKY